MANDISVGYAVCASSGKFVLHHIIKKGKELFGFRGFWIGKFKILHKHEIILFGFSSAKPKHYPKLLINQKQILSGAKMDWNGETLCNSC